MNLSAAVNVYSFNIPVNLAQSKDITTKCTRNTRSTKEVIDMEMIAAL